MHDRSRCRLAVAALVVLPLLGCATDDPLDAGAAQAATAVDDCGTGTANGNEDPASGGSDDEIVRPDDKIIDLRGEERVEVPIRDNVYEVRWFRVDPCTEVVFVNEGANPHNVVPAVDGAFAIIDQAALMEAPQSLVVGTPGDYPFYCSIHGTPTRGQNGFMVVGDA